MLMQVMMQAMGDDGVHDTTSPSSDESHKEWFRACSDIPCESPSLFPWHLISFQLIPKYVH
jgi:hypothetical protein